MYEFITIVECKKKAIVILLKKVLVWLSLVLFIIRNE